MSRVIDPSQVKKRRDISLYLLWLVVCLLISVFFMGPFVWMVLTAFKPLREILAWPPVWWPTTFTTEHFQVAWQALHWPRMFLNSTFVTTTILLEILFFCSLAGYAFAKLKFPGKNIIFLMVLAQMMVPMQVDLIPRFMMMARWGWVNSFRPLLVLAIAQAFHIFLYRQFFQTLPDELFDAAKVDGANQWQCYVKIAMPLSGPITATLVIFTFLTFWNDFLYPLIYLHSTRLYTVQLGLARFQSDAGTQYGPLMAASVFVTIPTIFVYLVFQKHFAKGIVMTGIKG